MSSCHLHQGARCGSSAQKALQTLGSWHLVWLSGTRAVRNGQLWIPSHWPPQGKTSCPHLHYYWTAATLYKNHQWVHSPHEFPQGSLLVKGLSNCKYRGTEIKRAYMNSIRGYQAKNPNEETSNSDLLDLSFQNQILFFWNTLCKRKK